MPPKKKARKSYTANDAPQAYKTLATLEGGPYIRTTLKELHQVKNRRDNVIFYFNGHVPQFTEYYKYTTDLKEFREIPFAFWLSEACEKLNGKNGPLAQPIPSEAAIWIYDKTGLPKAPVEAPVEAPTEASPAHDQPVTAPADLPSTVEAPVEAPPAHDQHVNEGKKRKGSVLNTTDSEVLNAIQQENDTLKQMVAKIQQENDTLGRLAANKDAVIVALKSHARILELKAGALNSLLEEVRTGLESHQAKNYIERSLIAAKLEELKSFVVGKSTHPQNV